MDEKSKILDKAQKLVQKGYLDKAVTEYKKIVDRDPKDATIRLRIGDIYVKLGKKGDAVKEYSEVAKIYSQKGFYLKAIAVYKQVLKLDVGQVEIHSKLADLYAKQGLIADTIAELSILMNFYEKKDKIDEAIDIIKRMMSVDTQNVGIRLKLGEYYQKKGFKEDALSEYMTAFNNLVKDGKLDKAEKLYQELYAENRRNVNILEGFIEIYRAKGDTNQLIKYYRELANLYKDKGENEKKKGVFEKILTLIPDDKDALTALGRTQVAQESSRKSAEDEEPLISWPKVSTVITPEPLEAEGETTPPAPDEEPLISWDEMIEVASEAGAAEEAVETKKAEPIEEEPAIKGLESDVEVRPVEEEKAEEIQRIVEEHKEEPVEEIHIEELSEEFPSESTEPVLLEEPAVIKGAESEKRDERPSGECGIKGVDEFMPEGLNIVEEIDAHSEERYVDLSSELGLEETLDFFTESWASDAKGKDTFTEFKNGVEKQLNREDTETHYNLGIAYMEMELYDDAMREFRIALKDPAFEFDCYTRLGLSLMAKGNYQEAINNFLKGIKVSGRTDAERKGLMYELGLAYEADGSADEALEVFKSICETDKEYREVATKVEELTEKLNGKDKSTMKTIPSMDNLIEVELL